MDTSWQIDRGQASGSLQSPISFVSYNENMQGRPNEGLIQCKNRRVLILYVGGTIGMTQMPNGALKPCKGYLTQVVNKMEILQKRTDISPFDIIEYDELLDSSEIGTKDYVRLAKDLERHYANYDGFLILHGTDTMHYTASALSFLLRNLAKPVVLTGSMVPLVEPYNDAKRNFLIGLMLVSNLCICEVCVFFNDRLMRGNCCEKIYHTFGAFCSLNCPSIGVVEATGFRLRNELLLPQSGGSLKIESDMSGRVVTFVLHADYDFKLIKQLLFEDDASGTDAQKEKENDVMCNNNKKIITSQMDNSVNSVNDDYRNNDDSIDQSNEKSAMCLAQQKNRVRRPLMDAVLFEITGVEALENDFSAALRDLAHFAKKRNIVACVRTREPIGGLSLNEQEQLNRISPYFTYVDMTCAAAETKLMYLFGKGYSPAVVRKLMPCNLRGEITPNLVWGGKL